MLQPVKRKSLLVPPSFFFSDSAAVMWLVKLLTTSHLKTLIYQLCCFPRFKGKRAAAAPVGVLTRWAVHWHSWWQLSIRSVFAVPGRFPSCKLKEKRLYLPFHLIWFGSYFTSSLKFHGNSNDSLFKTKNQRTSFGFLAVLQQFPVVSQLPVLMIL